MTVDIEVAPRRGRPGQRELSRSGGAGGLEMLWMPLQMKGRMRPAGSCWPFNEVRECPRLSSTMGSNRASPVLERNTFQSKRTLCARSNPDQDK